MEYTSVLRVQRALLETHRRNREGRLHVSYDEVNELAEAAAALRDIIEAEGLRNVRYARDVEDVRKSRFKDFADALQEEGVDVSRLYDDPGLIELENNSEIDSVPILHEQDEQNV